MLPKDVVKRAIKFENPARTPLYFRTDPERSDLAQVAYRSPSTLKDADKMVDEWGCVWENIVGTGTGYVVGYPLADWNRLESYKFPDPHENSRYSAVEKAVRDYPDKFVVVSMGVSGFTLLTALHGFENTLIDLYQERPMVDRLSNLIFDYEGNVIEELARRGANGVWFFDDWGTESALFISPKQWREIFKPRYSDQFQSVHDRGMLVFFHCCGYVWDIIPDLIEIGVDVLNLEQMLIFNDDLTDGFTRIRQTFGDQVCFTVNVDTQRTLPDGTPEEIRQQVEHIFQVFDSPQGGFLPFADAGKDHHVHPPENLQMVETLFERHAG